MEQLGLGRHPPDPSLNYHWDYASLANPPVIPGGTPSASSIYRGLVPAKNILNRDFALNGAMVLGSVDRGASCHHSPLHTLTNSFLGIMHTCARCPPIGSLRTSDATRCGFRRVSKRRSKLRSTMQRGCDNVTPMLCIGWTKATRARLHSGREFCTNVLTPKRSWHVSTATHVWLVFTVGPNLSMTFWRTWESLPCAVAGIG
jgi:hypothetical protein